MFWKRPKIILLAIWLSFILSIIFSAWNFVFSWLPEVSLSSLTNIPQKTIITDRNWEVLYTFFEEDRSYVPYVDIPPHVLMAVLSAEDRDYWNHEWIDKWWILRALINNIKRSLWETWLELQWASTISQQLIKNTYLTNERNLKRKVQEIITTRKVYKLLEENFRDQYPDFSQSKINLLVKKKILELYINLIYLGNNSYWIGTAARHYFWKEVSELSLLESSVIAWLPQAPSAYNPLVNRAAMMWDRQITDWTHTYFLEDDWENSDVFLKQIKKDLIKKSESEGITLDNPSWIWELRKGTFVNNDLQYTYLYAPWRKDYVLRAMFQEWYISKQELITAFIESIDIEFWTYDYKIKAPHFVFFVRDFILKNETFKELDISLNDLLQWWYTIRTTLDMSKQIAAEEAAKETRKGLESLWWSSRSLLHLDSKNWDILSYLWSIDYFDNEVNWQYDLIHARRQQWSTLKPFIFAKLLENYPLWIDWKISDNYYAVSDGPTPRNADWSYAWFKTISRALNNSRNLTAIRAFMANWWETIMKKFLKDIWLIWIIDDHPYWWTLALWSAEDSLYHLGQSYLQLSSPNDVIPTINPILDITGPYWENVYTSRILPRKREIKKWNAYQIWNILKNHQEVTPWWRWKILYSWIWQYAVKTWTTDIKKDFITYPKDGYVILYNADDTMLSWAWNVDSKPLNNNVLWSEITQAFVQTYIDKVGPDKFESTKYDRPNDLLPWDVYKHTKNRNVPLNVQEIIRK